MKYELKCNAPRFECHREYDDQDTIAKSDFFSLQSQLEARGYSIRTYFRNVPDKPLRGHIEVEVDGFFYYVELFKSK